MYKHSDRLSHRRLPRGDKEDVLRVPLPPSLPPSCCPDAAFVPHLRPAITKSVSSSAIGHKGAAEENPVFCQVMLDGSGGGVQVTKLADEKVRKTVYRKATNTARILHFRSNHPVGHKHSCVRTLFQRVHTHCSDGNGKKAEMEYLHALFTAKGYPKSFIRKCLRTPQFERSSEEKRKFWLAIPYVRNVSEMTARILKHLGFGMAHKPEDTIRQQLIKPNDPLPKSSQRAEVDAVEKFDILIQCIETKKAELVSAIQEERNMKQSALKDQIHQCTSKLTRSTGLIQFCIEMLKESDSLAFILVAQSLINRALNAEQAFMHEIEQPPVVLEYMCSPPSTAGSTLWPKGRPVANSSFLSLMETEAVHKAIADLSLHEGIVPPAPSFRAEECLAEGNIMTLVWQACPGFGIDHYTLELDDGAAGPFRVRMN
ncbi:unnamed protein product [Schistocephalus solidus]|uniref:BBC domain-containing protein n=1 Tax=Schistocephalus solidus TaxID=70667 RepID=A0A183T9L6_SCHSO|nr:unnamed protein product [Schistocephalus solidus]